LRWDGVMSVAWFLMRPRAPEKPWRWEAGGKEPGARGLEFFPGNSG
jgi:hypothetical protein